MLGWIGRQDTLEYAKICWIFVLLAHSVLPVFAQATNVTALDSRVKYVGEWVDQDNGGHELTTTQGSYVTFTFQGSFMRAYETLLHFADNLLRL